MALTPQVGRDVHRTVVLDAEAVSALAQKRRGMAERLEAARRNDQRVVIPSVVLAEVMTGAASDAAIWGVLKRIPVIDVDGRIAARAGARRTQAGSVRRTKRDLTVDAMVASVALGASPAVVVTADVDDLKLLVSGHDVIVSPI